MKNPLRLAVLLVIRTYQRSLSPDKGWFRHRFPYGFCPYHPHCSQYCYQAFQRYGFLRAMWYSVRRILRCHPWTKGGFDPLP